MTTQAVDFVANHPYIGWIALSLVISGLIFILAAVLYALRGEKK